MTGEQVVASGSDDPAGVGSGALDAARERRADLKAAVSRVEVAAASPAADEAWRPRLLEELRGLRQALQDHVDEVEGPGGLLNELTESAPRLAGAISALRGEHPTLCRDADTAIALVDSGGSPEEVRPRVLALLVDIAEHRQAGADVVYAAYSIDIGGPG